MADLNGEMRDAAVPLDGELPDHIAPVLRYMARHEDPFADLQRKKSMAILRKNSNENLLSSTVEVSPRLQRLSRQLTRNRWRPILLAHMAANKSVQISKADLNLLKN